MSEQGASHSTPASLLQRLNEHSLAEDWERFVRLYTPVLYAWARRLGLAPESATDLTQDVFVVLTRSLKTFRYDPKQRFRGWLWTVLINQHRSNLRRRTEAPAARELELVGEDNVAAWIDTDYRDHLVAQALELMRAEFPEHTWKACWEYVVKERPAAEVATELGITVNAVHLAKSRILRRLREELDGLLD